MRLVTFLYFIGGSLSFLLSATTIFHLVTFLSSDEPYNAGAESPGALAWDLLLLSIFILQHSAMKRSRIKETLKSAGLGHIERTLFVAATNVCLLLLVTFWQRSRVILWQLEGSWWPLTLVHAAAWYLVYCSALLFDLPELLGLRQLAEHCGSSQVVACDDSLARLYHHMRHPSFSALTLILLARPVMSLDRALLAALLGGYMFLAWNPDTEDLNYQRKQWARKKVILDQDNL